MKTNRMLLPLDSDNPYRAHWAHYVGDSVVAVEHWDRCAAKHYCPPFTMELVAPNTQLPDGWVSLD